MTAVALYTVHGVEDDNPDHPNAFFLPRLPDASITLAQLNDCFPLKDFGEFSFSYLMAGKERLWCTLIDDEDIAYFDNNNRLHLRVLPIKTWEEEEQEEEEPAPPESGATVNTEDLPDLQGLHTPTVESPAAPSPSPKQPEEALTPEEQSAADLKAEANKLFKAGQFPAAIEIYTKAIEALANLAASKVTTKLTIDCFGNRAACRIQERDFDLAIEDCNSVLEQQPSNAKALVRRGTCYEHNEKHKKALADFEAALVVDVKNKQAQQCAVRLRKIIKSIYG